MNKKVKTLALMLCLSAVVFAQETVTLTVDEAVEQAIENSRTLKSATIDLEISKRARDTSWGYFFPTVSANGTFARSNELTDNPFAPNLNPTESDHWSVSTGLSAQLNLSAALVNGIRSNYIKYEGGLISWEDVLRQTERDVRKMFYNILLLEENLQLQNESLENALERWEQSQINYRNGLVSELNVLQTQVSYESLKPAILEIEAGIKQQLSMFAFLIGYPYGTDIVLEGKIDPVFYDLNENEIVTTYTDNNLALQGLSKTIEAGELGISSLKMGTYFPTLSFAYSYAPALSDIEAEWANGDNWSDTGRFTATLSWTLSNMLPFSSNMVNIKDQEAALRQAELQYEEARDNIELGISNYIDTMEKSKASIEVQTLNMEVAQKAYDLTLEGFNAGTIELLELRDAELQLNQAKIGILEQELNYLLAVLDLEYSINDSLENK